MRPPSPLAATRAAAAIAPNNPIGRELTSGSSITQRTACFSRWASRLMSNTFCRSSSSWGSRRSNNRVAIPRRLSASATRIFRGLNWLDPLPCAKITNARAPAGRFRGAGQTMRRDQHFSRNRRLLALFFTACGGNPGHGWTPPFHFNANATSSVGTDLDQGQAGLEGSR
jgi:hypothetical protein